MKQIKLYPNNKTWVSKELRQHLKEKRKAFRMGDRELLKREQTKLESEIKKCKLKYKDKIKSLFESGDSRLAWQGLKKAIGCNQDKPKTHVTNMVSFVEDLNQFYCRFDNKDYSKYHQTVRTQLQMCDNSIYFEEQEIRKVFRKLKCGKAPGPDGVSPLVLKQCVDELAPVYTKLFQKSADEKEIPEIWKISQIVPVPKKSKPDTLNDYRPIALTSVAMKCMERLILKRIQHFTDNKMDNNQFAYKKGCSVVDAVLVLLNSIYKHLDLPNNYVRVLFLDYSSAFNTIQPHILLKRLSELNVPDDLCLWILNFLTNRKQFVKIGKTYSSISTVNTGAPQGCVLSPFLFTIYTNMFTAIHPECLILKYADDTVVLGRITKDSETLYRSEIQHVSEWCKENHLLLNTSKTKELIIDFRHRSQCQYPVFIDGINVEITDTYKYLGVIIDNRLKWEDNTTSIYTKGQQRLYFLRKLRTFHMDTDILKLFYSSTVQSVITYSFLCWWNSLGVKQKSKLQKIQKKAIRIIGCDLLNLNDLHIDSVITKVKNMIDGKSVLCKEINWLRSGRRLSSVKCRTERYKNSFIPYSVRCYNEHN